MGSKLWPVCLLLALAGACSAINRAVFVGPPVTNLGPGDAGVANTYFIARGMGTLYGGVATEFRYWARTLEPVGLCLFDELDTLRFVQYHTPSSTSAEQVVAIEGGVRVQPGWALGWHVLAGGSTLAAGAATNNVVASSGSRAAAAVGEVVSFAFATTTNRAYAIRLTFWGGVPRHCLEALIAGLQSSPSSSRYAILGSAGQVEEAYCNNAVASGGWTLVGHSPGTGGWWPGDFNLSSSFSLGTYSATRDNSAYYYRNWAHLEAGGSNALLFAIPSNTVFCAALASQVRTGSSSGTALTVTVIDSGGTARTASQGTNSLVRITQPEDPWFGCEGDHAQNTARMLHGEASSPVHNAFKNANGGVGIFVRSQSTSDVFPPSFAFNSAGELPGLARHVTLTVVDSSVLVLATTLRPSSLTVTPPGGLAPFPATGLRIRRINGGTEALVSFEMLHGPGASGSWPAGRYLVSLPAGVISDSSANGNLAAVVGSFTVYALASSGVPRSCQEAMAAGATNLEGNTGSGTYVVQAAGGASTEQVYCEMSLAGGGWQLVAHQANTGAFINGDPNLQPDWSTGTYSPSWGSRGTHYYKAFDHVPHDVFLFSGGTRHTFCVLEAADCRAFGRPFTAAGFGSNTANVQILASGGNAGAPGQLANHLSRLETYSSRTLGSGYVEDSWVSCSAGTHDAGIAGAMVWGENANIGSNHSAFRLGSDGVGLFVRRDVPWPRLGSVLANSITVTLGTFYWSGQLFCAAVTFRAVTPSLLTGASVETAVAAGVTGNVRAVASSAANTPNPSLTLSGLVPGNEYDVYCSFKSVGGVHFPSSTQLYAQTSTDGSAPSFVQVPTSVSTTATQAQINATLSERGTLFCSALPDLSTAPSAGSVRDGTAPGQVAFASAETNVAAPFVATLTLSGLQHSTNYDVFCVGQDTTLNLMAASFGPVNVATQDLTAPTVASLTIGTAPTNTGVLSGANSVALVLTVGEAIPQPTATFGTGTGLTPSWVSSEGGTRWTATVPGSAAWSDGPVAFTVQFADALGNSDSRTTTSDSSSVTVDKTAPTVSGLATGSTTETSTVVLGALSEPGSLECWAVADGAGSGATRVATNTATAGALSGSTYPVSVSLSGFAALTHYDIYCRATDAHGTAQLAPESLLSFRTADLTGPAVAAGGALRVATASSFAAELTAAFTERSNVYCVAVLDGTGSYTTGAQVKAAAQGALADPVKAQFVTSAPVEANAAVTISFTGLRPSTLYDAYCVAGDLAVPVPKLRALENLGGVSQTELFTQGCQAGNASVLVPTFQAAQSSIADPNLVAAWRSSRHYASHAFAFRGATNTAACNLGTTNTGSSPAAPWSYSASATSCDDTWTFTTPLTTALAVCGFSAAIDDSVATEYRATVDVTTVENGTGLVFGVPTNTTRVTSTVLGIRFPKQVNVTANVSAFGSVIAFAAVTSQQVNTASGNNVTLVLATSVQHPYELAPLGAATTTQAMQSVSGSASRNLCSGTAECTQEFELALSPQTTTCALDTGVTQQFTVRCRAGFTGSCDLPVPAQTSVTFRVVTDNFCARVVEVASITPTLRVYSTAGDRDSLAAQATDATIFSELFYRVDAVPEGGLAVTSVTLLDVEVRSFCTNCADRVFPVRNGVTNSSAAADYGFVIGAVAGSRRDFQLTLNDNSISFDNDEPSGQVQVQVTVGALVNYTEPSGQQASKRLQLLAAVPGSSQVSASARFGAGSSPVSPSSSSASSSSVFTVGAVAGVAGAVVAVLAATAFAIGRRRRQSASGRRHLVRSSSSSDQSAPASAPSAAGTQSVQLDSLQQVQSAYHAVNV